MADNMVGHGRVTVTMGARCPMVPNYIKAEGHDDVIWDVAGLADDTLRMIGEQWTERLIENARRRRAAQGGGNRE